jgi:dihydropteroate synthase
MGILNVTPDSFYDGGKFNTLEAAVRRGRELAEAGAELLDVGGESTRPGAEAVSATEEIARVVPVIERLATETGALISADTRKAAVARAAMAAGAAMINDVSALSDPEMGKVAADAGAALCLMHMQGAPKTMQDDPRYDDLFGEIIAFLRERMARARAAGVSEDRMLVDPGIGFGKTVAHNLELIRDLGRLSELGRPILLGPSNKSFIGKVLGAEPDDRGPGTAAAIVAGVLAGANILRVHDPAAMKPFRDMAWAIKMGEEWKKR